MEKFCGQFGDYEIDLVSVDNILEFMNQFTEGRKPRTKRVRFTSLSAFFSFAKDHINPDMSNPCDSPVLRKLFRSKVKTRFDILEKDTVDEIIFRTGKVRDRLMLELMARGAMRIGEVLKIQPADIAERKILLREPKSGRENEMIFIPQKVAERLKDYIKAKNIGLHDLRRHAATFASRSGVPLEIVSKIILRHSNLSTTQLYLGKVSDVEAIRWIENIFA